MSKSKHVFKLPNKTEGFLLIVLGIVLFSLALIKEKKHFTTFVVFLIIALLLQTLIIFIAVHNNKSKGGIKTRLDLFVGGLGYLGIFIIFGAKFVSFFIAETTLLPFFATEVSIMTIKFIGGILTVISNAFFGLSD